MKNNSWVLKFLLIVLGIILGGGVVYLYKQNDTLHPLETPALIKSTPTTPTPNPTAVEKTSDPTANWKTYTSTRLGLTFKYPPAWGEVKEEFNDVTAWNKENNISPEEEKRGNGQTVSLSFTNSNTNSTNGPTFPHIIADSSDYQAYEGGSYTGTPLEEVYSAWQDPYYKPNNTSPAQYFKLAGSLPALKFATTNSRDMEGSVYPHVKVYAQLKTHFIGGVTIVQAFSNRFNTLTTQEQQDFIRGYEDNSLPKQDQEKLTDFNLFLASFRQL